MTPRSRRKRHIVILLPAARFATPSFVFADPAARSAGRWSALLADLRVFVMNRRVDPATSLLNAD
jgi:hypothetical protein